jgi:hypothetical protein
MKTIKSAIKAPIKDPKEHICKYCDITMSQCLCTRTQHVYNYKTGRCELCGESFEPNGTGPKNKWYTFLIKIFPFNRWVDDVSDLHDVEYFEGYTNYHRDVSDKNMYTRTCKKIERTWWLFPSFLWKRRAKLNYIAVKSAGDDSFNWSGCTGEYRKPIKVI